jgi:hypothetical protein
MTTEPRSSLRRGINSFGMRNGEAEESKIFSTIGKGFCIWFLYKYSELLIEHENVLFVLLLFLIFPELIKKIISVWAARQGVSSNFVERTEHTARDTTVTTGTKVDNPDA